MGQDRRDVQGRKTQTWGNTAFYLLPLPKPAETENLRQGAGGGLEGS